MIRKCSCQHAFQDKKHGAGNRVHNQIQKKGEMYKSRCTVCGNMNMGSQSPKK